MFSILLKSYFPGSLPQVWNKAPDSNEKVKSQKRNFITMVLFLQTDRLF